jgi:hypothetical protein
MGGCGVGGEGFDEFGIRDERTLVGARRNKLYYKNETWERKKVRIPSGCIDMPITRRTPPLPHSTICTLSTFICKYTRG